MDEGTDSRAASFERKRPFDLTTRDDNSNPGSAQSTPRKRAKRTGKLGHQDLRDFVPAGANFSQTATGLAHSNGDQGEDQDDADYEDQEMLDELGSGPSEERSEEGEPTIIEGRRLRVGNLPEGTTVDDIRRSLEPDTLLNGGVKIRGGDAIDTVGKEVPSLSMLEGRRLEDVEIAVHPRTKRPTGYAFVDVASSLQAQRAIFELSGQILLERKVSVQLSKSPAPVPDETSSPTKRQESHTQEGHDTDGDSLEDEAAVKNESSSDDEADSHKEEFHRELQKVRGDLDRNAASKNWNTGSSINIRTKLGGNTSWPSLKDIEDLPEYRDMAGKQQKALRQALGKLSSFPSSKTARGDVRDEEVDYYYCLNYPADQKWCNPPHVGPRTTHTQTRSGTLEWRIQFWDLVKKCIKEGTLHKLKNGELKVDDRSVLIALAAQRKRAMSSGGTEDIDKQRQKLIATQPDPEELKKIETKEVLQTQADLLSAFSEMSSSAPNYERMRDTIRKNTVDLRYCEYYPSKYPYQSLALARLGLAESTTAPKGGESKLDAAQFWKKVEHCPQEGMLRDLRDGRIDAWARDKAPEDYEIPSAVDAPDETRKPPSTDDPRLDEVSTEPMRALGHRMTDGSAARTPEQPSKHKSPSDDNFKHSESEGEVILNVQPVHYIESSASSSHGKVSLQEDLTEMWNEHEYNADSESRSEDTESDMDDDGRSEDGDAMMDYSNSDQPMSENVSHLQDNDKADAERTARVLRDLSPRELNAQLRYFHTTKDPANVSQDTLVRCLVCAEEAHMAAACKSLTCAICGAYNQHTTRACPQNTKCSKCREIGHDSSHCPYKLKNFASNEILCDLCQQNGHAETDCELQWRTSGVRPLRGIATTAVSIARTGTLHRRHNRPTNTNARRPMQTSTGLCQALRSMLGANIERDYCDVYLTHDSMSVRKAHNSGRNHERNVLDYYQ
ncbi:protein AIR1/2, partial [Lecanoromycetidae sp. Uapishka_2]